ncbi:MAG: alpha-amylase [Eubacteriales bacterium]|nr:alpha-amylase [Eubacteriales bacterium]
MENAIMLQAFEWNTPGGNYFRRLGEAAPALAKAGFNAVWLPPVCKGMSPFDVGYGIYDLWDLGEFDQKGGVPTKYGTKEELLTCIRQLHDHDIRVYADVVLNHKAGADFAETFQAVKVSPDNRLEDAGPATEIEGWTGFNFPGRDGRYSDFTWHAHHFTGVDYDNRTGETAIYRIIGEGKYWAGAVSKENGNFDYLMFANIDHRHPEVRDEIFRWVEWFVGETGVDGFRLDAVKHIDADFIRDLCAFCEEKFGHDFYLFGEYWVADADRNEDYLAHTEHRVDIFDVRLHYNLQTAADNPNYDLRQIFAGTVTGDSPLSSVTFVDNHDSQPGQSLSSWVNPDFKERAYALILLRRDGYPCIFAGDYFGLADQDGANAIPERIERLMLLRRTFAYGDEEDLFHDADCIGWIRHGNEAHPDKCVVVISRSNEGRIVANLGPSCAGRTFIDYTGNYYGTVVLNENGEGTFPVPPAGISCWAETGREDMFFKQ